MTALADWRAATVYVGIGWYETADRYYECLEHRNDASGSTQTRVVGVYDDVEHTAQCLGCLVWYDHDELGGTPEGPLCCSWECERRWEEDALTVCCDCGERRPTRIDDGDHVCTVCASQRLRERVAEQLRAWGRAAGLLPAATPGDDGAAGSITARVGR